MKRTLKPAEQLSTETRELYNVLNNESDLACVVIGAAFLDTTLGTLVARKLIPSSVTEKLLAPSGALGSFATRADLAYCLGVVKKSHYQDLCKILEIRNQFAHSHLQFGFHHPTVRQLCDQLNEWRVIMLGEPEESLDILEAKELTTRARNQFNLSVVFLANWLLLNALSIKPDGTA